MTWTYVIDDAALPDVDARRIHGRHRPSHADLAEFSLDQEVALEARHGVPFCPCRPISPPRARHPDRVSLDANTRAIFGRSYVGEPDVLTKELAADEAIASAGTLLVAVPNTLGVDPKGRRLVRHRAAPLAPSRIWRARIPATKRGTKRRGCSAPASRP